MKCPSCGIENIDFAFVCKNCGAKLRDDSNIKISVPNHTDVTNSNNVKRTPKEKKNKKRGFFYGLLKVLSIIFIIWLVVVGANKGIKRISEYKLLKSLSGGFDIKSAKDYKDAWQSTMSDIDGLTVWDKYERGLAVNDGSDSDGDGLTDKEEIEVYYSDPLKVSTSGDLYSDGYKVLNGMDVNTYYEYEGEKSYPFNECTEVSLEAVVPTDFNAVVINHTGRGSLNGNDVLAQYEVYNYGGVVTIDIHSILEQNSIQMDDVAVYVSDGAKIYKYKYTANEKSITLKKKLDANVDYEIYVVKKSILNDMAITFGIATSKTGLSEDDVTGEGFVSCSPLLSAIISKPVNIYYQQFLNEEKTSIFKGKVLKHAQNYLGENDTKYFPDDSIVGTNPLEIKMRYMIFNEIVPFFDVTYTDSDDIGILNLIYMYYSYADKVAFENAGKEKEKKASTSGFDIEKDELPFGNFRSDIGTIGNCAGISHLTAYLYNTGSFDGAGSYSYEGKRLSWDISKDAENNTLRDKELYDYKTETFVIDHSADGVTLNRDLSDGENEFIKMIEANYMKGNDFVNMLYQTAYGGQNGQTEFDYELVEEMKARLESGKILDVYMRMVDGTGHAVNIYGYEEDKDDSNVTWFNVYDSNFPMDKTGENTESETGFKIRVTKKHKANGTGSRFDFEYYPIDNKGYGSTSNCSVINAPLFIVMDEYWNDINPVAKYEGDVKRFDFYYVGTAEKSDAEIEEDGTADHTARVVFRDSYFANPSCGEKPNDGYNASLATCSLSFAMSAFGSNDWGDKGEQDYSIKFKNVENFLQSAGFAEFGCNEWYTQKPQSDSIGVAVANKPLTVKENDEVKNYTLLAIAVRGGGYESEWAGNFTIGESGQHYGFSRAKEQVIEYVQQYVNDNEISGDIKLWIVGYSRAAATANLVAGAIDDGVSLGESVRLAKEDMYAYCFEPPMGAIKEEINNASNYYNIYCIVNKNDPVTKVAMADLGFTTYGVEHYLPTSVSDGEDYLEKQEAMLSFYKRLDSYDDIERKMSEKDESAYPVDDFQMKKIVLKYLVPGGKKPVQDDLENNWTQAAYLDTMISALTVENVKSRKNYVDNYQNLIRTIFTAKYGTLFPNEPQERCQRFFDILIVKMGTSSFWGEFWASAIAPGITGKSAGEVVDNIVAESLNEAGINYYSPDLIKDFGTAITELIVPFVVSHPNYTTTAVCNLNKLGAAHYPELCLAWLRSQDPEYTKQTYAFDWSGSYRIIKVNCPVDVTVLDTEGKVVAEIENDKVREIKNSSIVSLIDEDGAKIVCLPANTAYSVNIKATDDGVVNISIDEFSGDEDRIVKAQIYSDISVQKKDNLSIDIPEYVDLTMSDNVGSIDYQVIDNDNQIVNASTTYERDDIYSHMYLIEAKSDNQEYGNVIGSGIRCEGDFAVINAYGNEGYHFVGWYEGETLISDEREFRFKVNSDVSYVAKFEEGNEPFGVSDLKDFMELNWKYIVIVMALLLMGSILIVWRRGKKNES